MWQPEYRPRLPVELTGNPTLPKGNISCFSKKDCSCFWTFYPFYGGKKWTHLNFHHLIFRLRWSFWRYFFSFFGWGGVKITDLLQNFPLNLTLKCNCMYLNPTCCLICSVYSCYIEEKCHFIYLHCILLFARKTHLNITSNVLHIAE